MRQLNHDCLLVVIGVSIARSSPPTKHGTAAPHNAEDINQNVCIFSSSLSISSSLSLSPSHSRVHVCREEMRKELEIKFKKLMKERKERYVSYTARTAHKMLSFFSTLMPVHLPTYVVG